MAIIPVLLALGVSAALTLPAAPQRFDIVCDGFTNDVYDGTSSRPFHWEGSVDLEAQVVRNRDDGQIIRVALRDDGALSWGTQSLDLSSNVLTDVSASPATWTRARCVPSPLFQAAD